MPTHTPDASIAVLSRAGVEFYNSALSGNHIIVEHRQINGYRPIGIKCWGRISYLTNYCGYILHRCEDAKAMIGALISDEQRSSYVIA